MFIALPLPSSPNACTQQPAGKQREPQDCWSAWFGGSFAYLGSGTPHVRPGLKSSFRLLHLRRVLREADHHIQCVSVEEIYNDLPLITRTLNAERNTSGSLRRLLDCRYLSLREAVSLRCGVRREDPFDRQMKGALAEYTECMCERIAELPVEHICNIYRH